MTSDYIFRKATFGGFNREDVIKYISEVKANEAKLTADLDSAQKELSLLKEQVQVEAQKNINTQNEWEDKFNKLAESHKNEIESIKQEYEEKLQNSILADRSAEEKVGTAMIDVRRYADLLMHETCEKIDKMAFDADEATAKTLSRVLDISSGIQTFSDKLNSILKDILTENEEICRELTGFKGSLKLPFEEASGKIQADLLGD